MRRLLGYGGGGMLRRLGCAGSAGMRRQLRYGGGGMLRRLGCAGMQRQLGYGAS